MRYVFALLAVAGVVVSSLALHAHYTYSLLPCDINSHWDCGLVNHSRYALWHGIPVAIIGIVGYAVIGITALLRLRWVVLLLSLGALAFALRLTYIEDKVLEVWCLYCVGSQIVIAIIALLALIWPFVGTRRAVRSAA
jgi:vitamin-K-epoxide reductase (warfarin-sensitive)